MATTQSLEGHIIDDRYTVCKRLQSGFYGATWLATDSRNDYKDVCLKTFFSESPAQEKELEVLRRLRDGHFSHENLCAVLAVSSKDAPVTRRDGAVVTKAQYVVFEYCSGTDLFSFLVTGPFERRNRVSNFREPLAAHYFTQASLAVIYLHERGVYHRDIKPENCVLDEHFNLKLTDFGTNKILPVSDDPTKVLRTKTKGIGTDNYRAPEVNAGLHSYDPSAADIWSLGVTLFFLVGIEEMVAKVKDLDHYARSVLAPLGILFPFPLHCSKLDSFMKTAAELSAMKMPLPNKLFWREWSSLSDKLSPSLCDLFNQIFVLEPSMRITMQNIVRHPWVSKATKLSPDDITRLMRERCPRDASPSAHAQPKALSGKQLGGVDQATLRQSLSRHGDSQNPVVDYLSDTELWVFTDTIRHLEATQLSIVKHDIQSLMIDLSIFRQLLKDILAAPYKEEHRTVNVSVLASPWMTTLLCILGFLPQEKLLYLPSDHLDLLLLSAALYIIHGIELAVTRGAIHVESSPTGSDDDEEEEEMVTDMATFTTHQDTPPVQSVDSGYDASRVLQSQDSQMDTLATTPTFSSSQDSGGMCWTQYSTAGGSISAQSSQEECPEAMVDLDGAELSRNHALLTLEKTVDTKTLKPAYRAASEFCKLSGLLCSYGLYQVVISEQLCLYCRGNAASFSARIVLVDHETGTIGISSWCFNGMEEWVAILERLNQDMKPQQS